jgi:hypothetical protein
MLLRLIFILSVCQNLIDLSSNPLGRFMLVANTSYEVLLVVYEPLLVPSCS